MSVFRVLRCDDGSALVWRDGAYLGHAHDVFDLARLLSGGGTISVCPECGAQEQPSPVPGLLAETTHAEACSGPENVALEVVPRAVADETPDRSAYQERKLREVLLRRAEDDRRK